MSQAAHIDSHAHLDVKDFDSDREAVISRAKQAGVRWILLIADATKPESVRTVEEMAGRHPNLYWAAGIDPHEAASARETDFERLIGLTQHPSFLAIGEIGLDYYYDYPRDLQRQVFLRQLQLAQNAGKPIIIHCRDAWADIRLLMREHLTARPAESPEKAAPEPARTGILHCFTGTPDDALDLVGLGFYVSFAGNLTFSKAESLRVAALSIPIDRLLAETDSPYLAPAPHRGRRNEPAFVVQVTRELARLRALPEDEMGARLTANFAELFQLNGRS
jgi:TatD DNase family protein